MRWTFVTNERLVEGDDIISVEAIKRELDVTFDDDDALIATHRDAAVQWVGNYLNRFLGKTKITMLTDELPRTGLPIPFAPFVSLEAVRVAGSVFADSRVIRGTPVLLLPPSGHLWPSYTMEPGAIEVDYTVGYNANEAPELALQGVAMACSILYDKPSDPEKEWEALRNFIYPLRYPGVG